MTREEVEALRLAIHGKPKKLSKYGNVKCEHLGVTFDSKRERDRWVRLLLLEKAGEIRELSRQVKFTLAPAVVIQGVRIPAMRYFADFTYLERAKDGREVLVVEDSKGVRTEGYKLKRHLMMSVHGIEVRET